jgi:ferrochelatase
MNISDVVNITNGELIGAPKIQSVNSATVYPSKVEVGDVFFSSSQEDIDSAVSNGAYAIIYDSDDIVKNDNEIAWIKVSDLKLAAMKLVRYVLLKKEIDIYLLNIHELSFLKMVAVDKRNVAFLSSDWRKIFEQIINGDDILFVGDDEELLTTIKPNIAKLDTQKDYQLISDTLFKCSFKIDGYVYQNYDIAPFHMEHLTKVLYFLDSNHIRYDLEKIRYTKHFVPVFIDNQLRVQSSSKSEKVVIFVDNLKDIYEANEYIYYRLKWIRSIILTPKKTKMDLDKNPVWFDDIHDVHQKLKLLTYNYAFVYNLDKSILPTLQQEYDLFNQ